MLQVAATVGKKVHALRLELPWNYFIFKTWFHCHYFLKPESRIMNRSLSTCPIPPAILMKLSETGFTTVEDLIGMKPSDLSKTTNISVNEALEVLEAVSVNPATGLLCKRNSHHAVSALHLLEEERSLPSITTFSEKIDNLFGDGIPLGKTTEICGAPGVGKTQLCLQLCIDVQIPEILGGVAGEAVFIDTEGSFMVKRIEGIAEGCVKHCKLMAETEGQKQQEEVLDTFTTKSILAKVHYYRCEDYIQLLALVNVLEDFLLSHNMVKLVVIDSIAFHFRHGFDDMSLRTRLLSGLAQDLIHLADKHKLAVVVTNQMTTRLDAERSSQLIPALGESWGHMCTIRLLLYWENTRRCARLLKAPHRPEATACFQVTTTGIRDVAISQTSKACTTEWNGEPSQKRLRSDS